MEMSKGNSPSSYFKQKCQLFSFYKTGEQEGRIGPVWVGGWYKWEGRGGGESVSKLYLILRMSVYLKNANHSLPLLGEHWVREVTVHWQY
jgi:hypothetical protein